MAIVFTLADTGSGESIARTIPIDDAHDRRVLHNVVAHPLLVVAPELGECLHERTIPEGEQ